MSGARNGAGHNRANLLGESFGRLRVISHAGSNKHQKSIWRCACECGADLVADTGSLRSGNTKSCGCLKIDSASLHGRKHGESKTRTYRIWQAMHNRCRNPKMDQWKDYGGRGITVCAEWDSYETFLADMGEAPEGLSIDRENTNGNYEKGNCRWATATQQGRNKRSNRVISFNGESMPLIVWAERLGIDQASLRERLDKWPLDRALTQQPRRFA